MTRVYAVLLFALVVVACRGGLQRKVAQSPPDLYSVRPVGAIMDLPLRRFYGEPISRDDEQAASRAISTFPKDSALASLALWRDGSFRLRLRRSDSESNTMLIEGRWKQSGSMLKLGETKENFTAEQVPHGVVLRGRVADDGGLNTALRPGLLLRPAKTSSQ